MTPSLMEERICNPLLCMTSHDMQWFSCRKRFSLKEGKDSKGQSTRVAWVWMLPHIESDLEKIFELL